MNYNVQGSYKQNFQIVGLFHIGSDDILMMLVCPFQSLKASVLIYCKLH